MSRDMSICAISVVVAVAGVLLLLQALLDLSITARIVLLAVIALLLGGSTVVFIRVRERE